MHTLKSIPLLIAGALLLAACSDDKETGSSRVSVTAVSLNKPTLTLGIGDAETLLATVYPENATDRTLLWSSSDPEIASVDSDGVVTALSPGEAAIVAASVDGAKTAICKVTVASTGVEVTGVSLDRKELALSVGESEVLTATVSPQTASNKNVIWGCDDSEIVRVDEQGVVTGVAPGKATVAVTTEDGGKTALCNVTVTPATVRVESVTLDRKELTITVGEHDYLTASVHPYDADNRELLWSSDNPEVVEVYSTGDLWGNRLGETTITVRTVDGGKTDQCKVTVVPMTVTAGGLEEAVQNMLTYGRELVLQGTLDQRDFLFMRDKMPELSVVDISRTTIVEWKDGANIYPANEIPEYAFSTQSGYSSKGKETLTRILLPQGITSIGKYAFNECKNLTGDLVIPSGVQSIGDRAYGYCGGLTGTLELPHSLKSIGVDAFIYCRGFSKCLDIPDSVESIGQSAFFFCDGFTELVLSRNLQMLDESAFSWCGGFNGPLTLPSTLTAIGDHAFYECNGFTGTLTIPGNIKTVGFQTFWNCSGFDELIIEDGVETIAENAFGMCTGFVGSLIIPESVKSIGIYGFGENDNFNDIHVFWTTPITYNQRMLPEKKTIVVPSGTKSLYESTALWRNHPIVERE